MNALTTDGYNVLVNQIHECESIEDAVRFVRQIAALKTALEAVDQFREKSVLYARLEAEALVRVCELGGASKIKGKRRHVAEWLYGLSESEREKYIAMCADGLDIVWVYKREIEDEQKLSNTLDSLIQQRGWLIEDLHEVGMVNMTDYANEVRRSGITEAVARDIIDGTRDKLRKAGGVGIGDEGVYVLPSVARNSEEVKKAILLRFESIRRDMQRIAEIHKASGVEMSYKDFEGNVGSMIWEQGDWFIGHILIAFSDMGLYSDDNAFLETLTKSAISREIKFGEKYNVTRKKLIENMYQNECVSA